MTSRMKKSSIKSPLRHHVSPKKLSKKKLDLLNASNSRITDFYNVADNWRETEDQKENSDCVVKESKILEKMMEKKSRANSPEKSARKYNLRQTTKKSYAEEFNCEDDNDEAYTYREEILNSKENMTKVIKNKSVKIKKAMKEEQVRKSQSNSLKNFLGIENNNIQMFKEDEIDLEHKQSDILVQKVAKISKPVKKEKIKYKSETKLSPIKFSPNIKLSPIQPKLSPSKSEHLSDFKVTQRKPPVKLNDTFTKYGLILPSYEELVRDEEELIVYSRKLNQACNIIYQNPIICTSPLKLRPSVPPTLLSCEHLPSKRMKQLFKQNIPFCLDIINGKSDSERHRNFMRNNLLQNNKFLTYNVSMIVFSTDQKQQLAKLCKRRFGDCDIPNPSQYYFKVLLPELCLKIFMEEHCMSKEEAIKYLENRPVEDFK